MPTHKNPNAIIFEKHHRRRNPLVSSETLRWLNACWYVVGPMKSIKTSAFLLVHHAVESMQGRVHCKVQCRRRPAQWTTTSSTGSRSSAAPPRLCTRLRSPGRRSRGSCALASAVYLALGGGTGRLVGVAEGGVGTADSAVRGDLRRRCESPSE